MYLIKHGRSDRKAHAIQRVQERIANIGNYANLDHVVTCNNEYFSIVTSVAVFDLDNTLVRGSSLFHFGWLLVRRRVIGPIQVLRYALAEFVYVRNCTEREGLPGLLAERLLGLVKGFSQEELIVHARVFAATTLRRHLIAEVVDQVEAFRKLGIPCYIATASPQELALAIAEELGMNGAIGTVSHVFEGRYTGALASPIAHGEEKARRVNQLFESNGYERKTSWAFSDSINDLPLLVLVENPVVVNADKNLRQIAELNDWVVLTSAKRVGKALYAEQVQPGI